MYSIGHIVFAVLSKKNQIYPMQIVEIVTKKTLMGEEINYILQAGPDKTKKISIDHIDGEIFESSEKARQVLIERATQQINRLVDAAISKTSEWYGYESRLEENNFDSKDKKFEDNFNETVLLPDGTLAKVNLKLPEF